jgi:uncharacterized membrane protein
LSGFWFCPPKFVSLFIIILLCWLFVNLG